MEKDTPLMKVQEAVDSALENEYETYAYLVKLENGVDRQMSEAFAGLIQNAGVYADMFGVSDAEFQDEMKRRGII